MKKGILVIFLSFLSVWMFSFLGNEEDQRGNKDNRRQINQRILDAYNLMFNKDVGRTVLVFQIDPQDSIQIECPDCIRLMAEDPSDTKGTLQMSLQSVDATKPLNINSFGKWIKVKSSNGKVGVVFERDKFGEKNFSVKQLRVWRKTKVPFRDVEGVPMPLVDINNIFINKLLKDASEEQLRFGVTLKSDDQVQVTIKGVSGAVPDNLVCNSYKQGEEFDKSPVEVGAPYTVPPVDGGRDQFFFDFSHIEGIKGVNTYHIDVERIPAHSTGYLNIDEDTTSVDSALADTVVQEEPVDPFLKYLELMQGAPDFTCTTPESKLKTSIDGRFILGTGKVARKCIPLELTDECVAADECVGCDSIWAFWIGAGDNIINRYNFKDSTRKIASGEGLIEAWARSRRYRGMTSSRIFPDVNYGEDIFFAIIDQSDTTRFLNTTLVRNDWLGDYVYTLSPLLYKTSFSYILKYDPNRPVSLCMCNNNAVTKVPIMFRFQQFLTEPKRPAVANGGAGG